MLEENFIAGNSVLHRLDPRAKTIVACVFSIVVAISDRYAALIPAVFVALSLTFVASLPVKKVFSRLLVVNIFIFFLWLFLPFTTKGRPLFSLGPLVASKEGVLYATMITLKSNAIILALMALLATMSIFTMARALRYLHIPSKIVHLIFFTYRYIHVINQEYRRLMNAIKIRGFNPGNNLHTYRTYAFLVGMLLIRSHDRAERVRAAMLCRGFRGKFYDLKNFSMRNTDYVVMFLMLFATTGIALLQWMR